MKWILVKEVEGKEKKYFTVQGSNKWTPHADRAYKFPNEESAKNEASKYKDVKIEERLK